ncbi:M23 family metallopeptidase [Aquihabitans sp. G128]|uniref:M23 family metallopeptidase n=1 Tax=Aquihabitans sp. G128 TaxID=2849779 RepID=UPI001C237C18|nr:M23 family metallopeptidase [Aquihabitans sp. G128]QXC62126.1 M23 family metallopeptidase [Aquihabitans sp. G128]
MQRFVRAIGRRRVASAVVAAALLTSAFAAPTLSGAAPATPAAPRQEGQDGADTSLKGEYDEVIGQESALVDAYQASQLKRVALTKELDRLKADLHQSQVDLLGAHAALDDALALEKRQVAARKAADRRVTDAEDRLRKQIVAAYVRGGDDSDVLTAILGAENGEEAGQAVAYSRAAVGDSDQLVKELEDARADRRRAERSAKRARAKAKARRDDIEEASRFIAASTLNQGQLVDEVNVQVADEQAKLREVQARKAIIEGRINSINRSSDGVQLILAQLQAGQPDWVPGDVEITNPIPGYKIGSKFGMRFHPILHVSRLHAGGDLGAPSGTMIYAPADGVVVIAGERGGYGNATVIDHGHSLATLYGHQSQILVQPGQVVKRGDPIGRVGSTGLSTGPHLHFETRIKGVPIDPEGVVDFNLPVGSYEQEARERTAAGGN